ncbi:EipA family protein, partial [Acinetobacter baumannii]
ASEVVENGHRFFGSVSRGLALTVEEATRRWGEPNGYILGQEASGAIVGGLRFGEGTLYTRNAGQRRIYWQGPTLGFDVGGDG